MIDVAATRDHLAAGRPVAEVFAAPVDIDGQVGLDIPTCFDYSGLNCFHMAAWVKPAM